MVRTNLGRHFPPGIPWIATGATHRVGLAPLEIYVLLIIRTVLTGQIARIFGANPGLHMDITDGRWPIFSQEDFGS